MSTALAGRPLSARERQVVELVAHGMTDAAIAAELNMSIPTMRRRLELARYKLGAANRAHAAALAVARGIVRVTT